MERASLQAESRAVQGKKVKQLRAQEWVPAVLYGPDTEPLPIQAPERDMQSTLHAAGSTALIDLTIKDAKIPRVVLARDIQRDALTGRLLHVDFYEVRLTEKVKTTPQVVLVGNSPLVSAGTAVLIHSLNEIEVECLPTDLISTIEVDVSVLERMEDTVTASDLPVPPGVTILADPGDLVVSLVPIRAALRGEEEEGEVPGGQLELGETI